eukprot:CAMPEP_0181198586 /NCGR_PEP_ID=MMETSP1096-20121128/16705_1 /TAXON_ID=156174 ORGANISM="Chrysochromulina ericina, Strain CCMP281" /NCGR_SAMPLE_ID=MMETSP1096 /ASSEMBLY_ACC=CAM_ASM_000453 /LENGTH=288 /DNA_ID=CAMNT_0023288677 /DNA_START=100 /DNA_END=966 /DNA_ORIENTATION=+
MCFAQVMDSPTASVLIFVYLVVGVVILMNMLIAMMAKTFDSVFENSERNYMVMRVKFFVAYDDSDWPAPLNGLGMPYAIFKSSFDVTADKTCAAYTWCRGKCSSCYSDDYRYEKFELPSKRFKRQKEEAEGLSEDLDSIEPSLNDRVNSSAFQIQKWKDSRDPSKPVERAIMPSKLLKWVDRLKRFTSYLEDKTTERDIFEEDFNPDAAVLNAKDGRTSVGVDSEGSTVSKHEVYNMLAKYVKANLTSADYKEKSLEGVFRVMSRLEDHLKAIASAQNTAKEVQAKSP